MSKIFTCFSNTSGNMYKYMSENLEICNNILKYFEIFVIYKRIHPQSLTVSRHQIKFVKKYISDL